MNSGASKGSYLGQLLHCRFIHAISNEESDYATLASENIRGDNLLPRALRTENHRRTTNKLELLPYTPTQDSLGRKLQTSGAALAHQSANGPQRLWQGHRHCR